MAIGRSIDRMLKRFLQDNGFLKEKNRWGFTLYVRRSDPSLEGNYHAIVFDRSAKIGGLRIFLCLNCLPVIGCEHDYGPNWKYVESRTWNIFREDEEEAAITAAREFLTESALRWFDNPYALSATAWRERHGLRTIIDTEVVEGTVSWPPEISLAKAAVLLAMHVDDFAGVTPRELLSSIRGKHAVRIRPRNLANMLDLEERIAHVGLKLEYRQT